jgi:hypothetical protein
MHLKAFTVLRKTLFMSLILKAKDQARPVSKEIWTKVEFEYLLSFLRRSFKLMGKHRK